MIRLGLRLALSGGRGSAVALALAALAVGLGTAVLLFALSFLPALEDRASRDAWRQPVPAEDPFGAKGLLFLPVGDRYDGEPLLRVLVAAGEDAPLPPGIPTIPSPGEAYVSPALAALMARVPSEQLADRVGRVIGIIGPDALRSPEELLAFDGREADEILAAGGGAVVAFPTDRAMRDLPPIAVLIVTLAVAGALAPVAVFVATATRLSATRREQRLAALRLIGATTGQTVRLAVIEALAVTTLGAAAGVALFFAVRPLVARIPLGETTWWPEAIAPPLVPALLLLLAVPLVGAIAAVVGLRRVAISPLGLSRRSTPPVPSAARLVPLGVATIVLLGLVVGLQGSGADPLALVAIGISFALIIGGIAYAGPWLTALIGRALGATRLGGAATLLAARRLADDPRGSFGAIAGVIMAVFVAVSFLTFVKVTTAAAGTITTEMRPGQVWVAASQLDPLADAFTDEVSQLPGVTGVLPVRGAQVEASDRPATAWIVSCAAFRDAIDSDAIDGGAIDCSSPVLASIGYGTLPAGRYRLVSDTLLPDASGAAGIDTLVVPAGGSASFGLMPNGRIPELILDPAALRGGGASIAITGMYVSTDGTTAAMERVRTRVSAAHPAAYIRTTAEQVTADPTFEELGRVIVLGLFGTMLLAGCSLVVAVTTSIADRRRQFTLLRSAGMGSSTLARLVLVQGGAPLTIVAIFSAAWAIVVTQGLLALLGTVEPPVPDASVVLVVAGSVGLAMGILALALPLIDRLTRPDVLRTE